MSQNFVIFYRYLKVNEKRGLTKHFISTILRPVLQSVKVGVKETRSFEVSTSTNLHYAFLIMFNDIVIMITQQKMPLLSGF